MLAIAIICIGGAFGLAGLISVLVAQSKQRDSAAQARDYAVAQFLRAQADKVHVEYCFLLRRVDRARRYEVEWTCPGELGGKLACRDTPEALISRLQVAVTDYGSVTVTVVRKIDERGGAT